MGRGGCVDEQVVQQDLDPVPGEADLAESVFHVPPVLPRVAGVARRVDFPGGSLLELDPVPLVDGCQRESDL